ncbi:uncharacterized protein LOC134191837 [Corticium candelabrum]|uniref:uncharacterized protein LOC134191837 n=1 Tax=Corticium candelabrum TaxID=121492 RepID=UPI002E25AE7D|nr:uncharacterized protein LOC134191837 [Corticium candelabrum]
MNRSRRESVKQLSENKRRKNDEDTHTAASSVDGQTKSDSNSSEGGGKRARDARESVNGQELSDGPRVTRDRKRSTTRRIPFQDRPSKGRKGRKRKSVREESQNDVCRVDSDEDLPVSGVVSDETRACGDCVPDALRNGQVVWVKVRRYPHWPAVIVKMQLKQQRKRHVFVNFFNYDGPSYACRNPRNNIRPFNAENNQLRNGYDSWKDRNMQEAFYVALNLADSFILQRGLQTSCGEATPVSAEKQKQFDEITKFCSLQAYKPSIPSTRVTGRYSSVAAPVFKFEVGDESDSDSENDDEEEEREDEAAADKLTELEQTIHAEETLPQYNDMTFVINFVKTLRDELFKIFTREEVCDRHTKFFSQRAAERNMLKRMSGFGPVQEDLHEKLINELHTILNTFNPPTNLSNNNYVFEVMLPETITRLISDVEEIPHNEAKDKYLAHITGQT